MMNGLRKCDIVRYTHTHINEVLFSHKEDDTMLFEGKWRQLEDIMLNEVSQV
jgi:hypothetical protein